MGSSERIYTTKMAYAVNLRLLLECHPFKPFSACPLLVVGLGQIGGLAFLPLNLYQIELVP